MRRKKGLERGIGLTFLALFLVVLPLASSDTLGAEKAIKPIDLKFSHFVPPHHFLQADGFMPWAKAVEQRSGGRVKITFYPGETLSKGKDNFDSAVTGVADIAWVSIAYTPGLFPLTEIFFAPRMANISAETCTHIYHELYEKFPQIRAEYSKVKVLWLHIGSSAGLLSAKKPIRRLEDVEKMVIRAVGPNGETAKALGATPVSMTVPDVYMAMERGSVDAALVPIEALIGFKLHEVTKYLTLGFQAGYGPYLTAMNLKVWNSLPSDIQRIMDEESAKAAFLNARGWDKSEKDAIELMKSKGAVINLSEEESERWQVKLKPLWDKWVADREAKKLPGKQVCDEALRLFKKYEQASK